MIELLSAVQPALLDLLVAQADPAVDVDTGPGLLGGAVGSFLTTLIVGAIMVAIRPNYTERLMAEVLEDPLGSFIYQLLQM